MQSKKDYFNGSVIARLIASILLLIALSNQQIGYYKFLRWIVCVAAIYTAFISYLKKEKINLSFWIFGLIAILFNPIIPFYLEKNTWSKADLNVAAILIISTFIIEEKNKE
jgi:FtsH-binding integral membrane protein